jgi:hypothetical protein
MTTQGGFGVVLKINTGSLTAIVHVMEVDFPEMEKILFESTAHDSASGYAEWKSSGKRKLSDFKAKIHWDISAATHLAVQNAFASTSPIGMSIEDPGGSGVIAFNAHIQKMSRISEQEEGYFCEVTIQPTSKPTIT